MAPLVSVCMPAYNAEKYIGQALDSVLQQSYPHIEVIVVNDGSTDYTAAVLESYREKGVQVIHQENRGQCAAANAAFHHSTGNYIKFFDADDVLSTDFIAQQIARINGKDDEIASASWGRFLGDDLQTFSLQQEPVYQDLDPMDWIVKSMENGQNMMQCALWLIPRNVLAISGLWDERLSLINDFDFFIRVILASKKVRFANNAILYYRSGLEQSLSGQKSKKAMESAFLSIKLGTETILRYENSTRTRQICADALQLWKYQFYPMQPGLYREAEKLIRQLGGSSYPFPAGGMTQLLSRLLGWKLTKRIKNRLHLYS
ncbi:MAG: glycosyltransferase family 2 protein [Chitinophagaceae bacterium]|nr:MAG: glycosyltransferase family 2 protein [Chitinophagaceae bacterium]